MWLEQRPEGEAGQTRRAGRPGKGWGHVLWVLSFVGVVPQGTDTTQLVFLFSLMS